MIYSNSSIDWTKLMTESSKNELLQTPEFREWMIGLLAEQTATITFTKKDGTERTMKCTRNPESIPTAHRPKDNSNEKSSTAIPVFDLEAEGWRSFIPENIIRIEYDI
jgi:hypothetical protein